MRNAIAEKLNENPVIAAVAEPERLPAALASDCGVVFLLSGDILSIGALVDAVKNAGKAAMVHLELIEGLSGKEIAVDAIHALTRADGIISTRAAQVKRARQLGLATIQRGFLLDSRSVRSLQAQAAQGKPDYVEILPGVIPRVIAELAHGMNTPLIAGGLIKTKEEVVAALGAGAGGSRFHHGGERLGPLNPSDDRIHFLARMCMPRLLNQRIPCGRGQPHEAFHCFHIL